MKVITNSKYRSRMMELITTLFTLIADVAFQVVQLNLELFEGAACLGALAFVDDEDDDDDKDQEASRCRDADDQLHRDRHLVLQLPKRKEEVPNHNLHK